MNRKTGSVALCFAAALIAAGCGGASKEAAFSHVRQEATARMGYDVRWNQDAAADAEIAQAVREQLAKPLTAAAAVQIALLNNRRLQATYEELGVAQAAVVKAGLLSNPIFRGAVGFPISEEETSGNDYAFEVETDFLSSVFAPMRQSVAKSELEAAKLRVTAAVMDLAGQTRRAFYRVQADQQMLEMFRQVVLATQAAYEFAQRLHEAGNIPDLDLFLQQTFYHRAKLELAAAETTLAEDRERLNALMGLWGPDIEWTIESRLPDIPAETMAFDDLEKEAIANSLDLALVRQEIVSIGKQLGVVKATSLIPTLDIAAEVEREEGEWEAGPGLGLSIPLFDRGQARRAAAIAKLRRQQQDYYALAVEIRADVRAARRRLLNAWQAAQFYQSEMLPLQEQIVEQTQLQYNAMQIGVFRLLQAKQLEIDAGRQYIEALYDYWAAQDELEQIRQGRLAAASSAAQVSARPPAHIIADEPCPGRSRGRGRRTLK
jgi:cobalt-zinc-cadmium efflux system outer membrane protein